MWAWRREKGGGIIEWVSVVEEKVGKNTMWKDHDKINVPLKFDG